MLGKRKGIKHYFPLGHVLMLDNHGNFVANRTIPAITFIEIKLLRFVAAKLIKHEKITEQKDDILLSYLYLTFFATAYGLYISCYSLLFYCSDVFTLFACLLWC